MLGRPVEDPRIFGQLAGFGQFRDGEGFPDQDFVS